MQEIKKTDLFKVPFSLLEIVPELNIRKDMGDLKELTESIRENGIKVPLRGYRNGEKINVVDGHRRHAAMQLLYNEGVEVIASVILETRGTNDEQRIIDMVLTNEGKSLTPLELAEAVRRLIAYEYSESDIAKKFGKSQSYINRLNLLNAAPKKLRNFIEQGKVSATLAMSVIKDNKTDDLIEKIKKGENIDENISASGDHLKPKKQKITNRDIQSINSWNEFKKAASKIDENKINTHERKLTFKFMCRLMNNDLNEDQIKSYFLI